MAKRIILAVGGLLVLVGVIAGIKYLQIRKMIEQASRFTPPPETVTAAAVGTQTWESVLTAVGSLEAVRGVTVTAEVPGRIVRIAFEAGAKVRAGDLLVELETLSEEAQLPGAEAAVKLAKKNLERADELLKLGLITVSDHDAAVASFEQAVAQADNIRAAMKKKTVRAPFAGRLGIRQVNLGQILNGGEAIVSLQALDPIFADFLVPQQDLARVRIGLPLRVTTDALPGEIVRGTITAINPEVDPATRNVRIQAALANPQERLRPGMFVDVAVELPSRKKVLAVPATAILYAPYGDSAFVVEEKKGSAGGGSGKTVRQQFVRLGERRGDFVAVTSGLKAGDVVVTTGVFKLRNGQAVVIDNTLAPEFNLAPKPAEG